MKLEDFNSQNVPLIADEMIEGLEGAELDEALTALRQQANVITLDAPETGHTKVISLKNAHKIPAKGTAENGVPSTAHTRTRTDFSQSESGVWGNRPVPTEYR